MNSKDPVIENQRLKSEKIRHIPVLAKEVLNLLIPASGLCRVVDGTLGDGGHSSLILKKNTAAELLGIDRDGNALARAEKVLSFAAGRIHLKKDKFSNLSACISEIGLGWLSVDAVLLDLGVSSFQIDSENRGFSHRLNGPLDMRMDQQSHNTAGRILNESPIEELERIFREYGEIRKSRRLAEAIVRRRRKKPWMRTSELAELCEKIIGHSRPGRLPAPTLCFQALRIAVNNELEELKKGLEEALALLSPGGRLAVISFHSLEDRIVKRFFQKEAGTCLCPPEFPVCICNHHPKLKIITKKPITPTEEEIKTNRRAASAKLRVAEKLSGA